MTSSFTNGHSRATSARASRASSMVREIAKRRDKPYKTEKSLVKARKRKLDLHTSYTRPPPGYVTLLVGTPDLADLCKELSRQRGFPVNVLNAQPVSKNALQPEKVSHHIHRIGYHFRAEIVEEACAKLGYTSYRGRYIKETDLLKQKEQSRLAQTLAKYHIRPDALTAPTPTESPDQVRAAIKELFPKIPEADLESIVKHAWEEGTHRVGTNTTLDLPRRVQLATIARIRHEYTDYDRLLRAFEWKEARAEVEPACLRKLIEWRGEDDLDDDGELEEIVRETIVIDSDDDPSDDDSVLEVDPGNVSDTSIEVTHHVAGDGDLGAESVDEGSRAYVKRLQPIRRGVELRNTIAKQKIGAARQQLRNRAPPPPARGAPLHHSQPGVAHVTLPQVARSVDQGSQLRREVEINGQWYEIPPAQHQNPAAVYRYLPVSQSGTYPEQYAAPATSVHPANSTPVERYVGFAPEDRPIASIEMGGSPRASAVLHPSTPDSERMLKRRRFEEPIAGNAMNSRYPSGHWNGSNVRYREPPLPGRAAAETEVVDLTSPGRQGRPEHAARTHVHGEDRVEAEFGHTRGFIYNRPLQQSELYMASSNTNDNNLRSAPYDPTQPFLLPAIASARVAQIRDPPPSETPLRFYLPASAPAYEPQTSDRYYEVRPAAAPAHPPPQQPATYQPRPTYAQYVPIPVHGAPAPVQQAPAIAQFSAPIVGGMSSRAYPPAPAEYKQLRQPPANGEVAPTQYYYPT